MAFYPSIPTYTWDQLVHEWRHHEPQQTESDDGYLDDIALALRTHEAKGITFLRSQLSQPDGVRVSAAILGLSHPTVTDPAIANTFLDLLTDGRPRVRAAAVRGLAGYGRRDVLARIVLLLRDTSGLVRCAALEFVRQFDPEHANEQLVPALSDPDDVVRMCAADELDTLGDTSAVPFLRPLLRDTEADVRLAAETAIENLSGLAIATARAGAAD